VSANIRVFSCIIKLQRSSVIPYTTLTRYDRISRIACTRNIITWPQYHYVIIPNTSVVCVNEPLYTAHAVRNARVAVVQRRSCRRVQSLATWPR